MAVNMGGGLPHIGFYEMKQEIYEIVNCMSRQHLEKIDVRKEHTMSDKNEKRIVYSEPGGYFSKGMLETLRELEKAKESENSDEDEKKAEND